MQDTKKSKYFRRPHVIPTKAALLIFSYKKAAMLQNIAAFLSI